MDDNLPRTDTKPSPGEDLYGLSVKELQSRIEIYRLEIERLGVELKKKEGERSAADLLFKPKV